MPLRNINLEVKFLEIKWGSGGRNWPNGKYLCKCKHCRKMFLGIKFDKECFSCKNGSVEVEAGDY